jgi:hypothetical protein
MLGRLRTTTVFALFTSGVAATLLLSGCGGGGGGSNDDSTSTTNTSTTSTTTGTGSGTSTTTSTSSSGTSTFVDNCNEAEHINNLVCKADQFLALLTNEQQTTVLGSYSDSVARTYWSNLPNATRNGIALGDLDATARDAAMAVAEQALSAAGYEDYLGILAADDYLGENGGGSQYSSDNYKIAFMGTPTTSGDWMLQIGGHHLAYNITYLAGTGYPVPNHFASEPKTAFEVNSTTYAPIQDEGDALVAMFEALDSTDLYTAFLSGESYSDVLVGPDNGSGVMPTNYPTGANRRGMLVSDLTDTQRALVIAAIEQWVRDFPDAVSDDLISTYTSDAALADTYIAWAGDWDTGIDVDSRGTYMRIDGPRLWIELVCQGGAVLSGTHFHTMYRDKTMDYGNTL